MPVFWEKYRQELECQFSLIFDGEIFKIGLELCLEL